MAESEREKREAICAHFDCVKIMPILAAARMGCVRACLCLCVTQNVCLNSDLHKCGLVCACVPTCVSALSGIHLYLHISVCVCVCMCVDNAVCFCVCGCVYRHMCVFVCARACTFTCVCECEHASACVFRLPAKQSRCESNNWLVV